jgi:serine/threonine protein phosphatase PrpC
MMDPTLNLVTAAVSDRGLSDKRPQNEDSYLSMPEHGIFAVADGVGGAMAGDVASQMAVEIIGEAFSNYSGSIDPEEIMTVAIDRANTAINQMASELPQLASMATTIVALHISGYTATIAHVGDSRLYRLDREGRLYRETQDHSVVEEEVRAGRMSAEQAANHPSRNVISRAVGADVTVDVDVRSIILEPGTTFLICSDGITRHINDQEIADLLNAISDVNVVCDRMKELCYSRGAEDNLTAVVVRLPNDESVAPGVLSESAVAASDEEPTVASARTTGGHLLDDLNLPPVIDDADRVSDGDDDSYLMEDVTVDHNAGVDLSDLTPDDGDYESERVVVPASEVEPARRPEPEPERRSATIYDQPELSSGSGVGSVLRSIVYLLIGGAIGAAAVYYLWQSQPPPEPAPVAVENIAPRSNNVPASTLEELRWSVDRDPAAYAQARSASPQDATDFYLLGRALFLDGKQWEAEQQFKIVVGRKEEILPAQSAVSILADIAMMRAIMNSGPADVRFKNEYGAVRTAGGTATNTNSAINTNTNTAPASADTTP